MKSRATTPTAPDATPSNQPADARDGASDQDSHSALEEVLEEVRELPQELAGVASVVLEDIEASPIARWSIRTYVSLMEHAPKSTRGRLFLAAVICAVVLAPSLGLLYVSLTAGRDATEAWFGDLGYAGIFLANLASTATLFIPVPGLTAAAQALIISSGDVLSPFWVGIAGGLGMALGEVTAYVAGMAAAFIAQEEEIRPPRRLQPIIDRIIRGVDWLMAHYGMPTLFILSAVPNPLFEVAGWTAGATRFSFWRFMASVTPGKCLRGILLAYIGEKLIF
jgi:membrane protein DedA with SNARE-associated domain